MIIYIVFNRKFRLFIIEFLTPWMNKRRRRYASFRRRVGSYMLNTDVLSRAPLTTTNCTCRPHHQGSTRSARPSIASSIVCPFHSSLSSSVPLVGSLKTRASGRSAKLEGSRKSMKSIEGVQWVCESIVRLLGLPTFGSQFYFTSISRENELYLSVLNTFWSLLEIPWGHSNTFTSRVVQRIQIFSLSVFSVSAWLNWILSFWCQWQEMKCRPNSCTLVSHLV